MINSLKTPAKIAFQVEMKSSLRKIYTKNDFAWKNGLKRPFLLRGYFYHVLRFSIFPKDKFKEIMKSQVFKRLEKRDKCQKALKTPRFQGFLTKILRGVTR
jgi:hypothetical protein